MRVIALDTERLRRRTLAARLDRHLAGLGQGFNPGPGRAAALAEIARLDGLSDGRLRRLGLRRAEVTAHVVYRVWGV